MTPKRIMQKAIDEIESAMLTRKKDERITYLSQARGYIEDVMELLDPEA